MAGSPQLQGITLTVTERCNLRCGYCHARRSSETMRPEVADAAVDLLLEHSRGAPRLNVSFYGGEPFLEPHLLERILTRARAGAEAEQAIRCVTPTNGTRLDADALRLCRDQGIALAVSIDGVRGDVQRPYANGKDSTGDLLDRLPELLAGDAGARSLARMTVTPSNVGMLSSNVRAVARLGFRRIVFQPAWELDWTELAIRAWAREHARLITWWVGARAAGLPVPELPALSAIESRLRQGKGKGACGAGDRFVAVSTDGRIFPCYRFVFEPGMDDCQLGTTERGLSEPATLARFAALSPDGQRPEDGDCASCSARDGCTHYCPALGYLMLRDLDGVPTVVCQMMRAQVEAVRRAISAPARRSRRTASPGWAAAIVVAAGALSAAACGGETDTDDPWPASDASTDPDAGASDAGQPDVGVGGICPVQIDAGQEDVGVGGICPVIVDAGDFDVGGGGICPVRIEVDAGDDAEPPIPDVCGGIC